MRRREFIAGMAGAAVWPLATYAQQPKAPAVVGLLNAVSFDGPYAGPAEAIRQGLRAAGFVEGANLAIESRTAESHYDRLPDLVADLVRSQVAVIIAIGASTSALAAAKAAAESVPIVYADGADAANVGLVKSGNGPEANDTTVGGAPLIGLAPKRLEFMHELVRRGPFIGYLDNSSAAGAFAANVESMKAATRDKGRQLAVFDVGTEREIDTAFTSMALQGIRALIVSPDPYLTTRQAQIIELAAQSRIATIYSARDAVTLGGLMSYGIVTHDIYRLAGIYAGHILNGAAPADTPMIPTRYELVINNGTAKALRVAMPQRLLVRADEIIN
jgi:putative ABC transport system substrate-binding protein